MAETDIIPAGPFTEPDDLRALSELTRKMGHALITEYRFHVHVHDSRTDGPIRDKHKSLMPKPYVETRAQRELDTDNFGHERALHDPSTWGSVLYSSARFAPGAHGENLKANVKNAAEMAEAYRGIHRRKDGTDSTRFTVRVSWEALLMFGKSERFLPDGATEHMTRWVPDTDKPMVRYPIEMLTLNHYGAFIAAPAMPIGAIVTSPNGVTYTVRGSRVDIYGSTHYDLEHPMTRYRREGEENHDLRDFSVQSNHTYGVQSGWVAVSLPTHSPLV